MSRARGACEDPNRFGLWRFAANPSYDSEKTCCIGIPRSMEASASNVVDVPIQLEVGVSIDRLDTSQTIMGDTEHLC